MADSIRRIHLEPGRDAVARIHYPDANGGLFGYVVEYTRSTLLGSFRLVEVATVYEGQIRYPNWDDPFGVESFDHGEPSAVGEVRWDGTTNWRLKEWGQEVGLSGTICLLDMIRVAFMDALRIYLDAHPDMRGYAGVDLPALSDGEVSPVPEIAEVSDG
jgi:hypothetical protein